MNKETTQAYTEKIIEVAYYKFPLVPPKETVTKAINALLEEHKNTNTLQQQDKSEWVSVDDRLPDKDTTVLIFCKDRDFKSDETIISGWITGTKYWCSTDAGDEEDLKVTHWQTLPNAPQF